MRFLLLILALSGSAQGASSHKDVYECMSLLTGNAPDSRELRLLPGDRALGLQTIAALQTKLAFELVEARAQIAENPELLANHKRLAEAVADILNHTGVPATVTTPKLAPFEKAETRYWVQVLTTSERVAGAPWVTRLANALAADHIKVPLVFDTRDYTNNVYRHSEYARFVNGGPVLSIGLTELGVQSLHPSPEVTHEIFHYGQNRRRVESGAMGSWPRDQLLFAPNDPKIPFNLRSTYKQGLSLEELAAYEFTARAHIAIARRLFRQGKKDAAGDSLARAQRYLEMIVPAANAARLMYRQALAELPKMDLELLELRLLHKLDFSEAHSVKIRVGGATIKMVRADLIELNSKGGLEAGLRAHFTRALGLIESVRAKLLKDIRLNQRLSEPFKIKADF